MSVISDTEKNQPDSEFESPPRALPLDKPVESQPKGSSNEGAAEKSAPRVSPPAAKDAKASGIMTLAIDIGGTGVKSIVLDPNGNPVGERQRQPTPRPATPQAILATIKSMLPDAPFGRVSIGFPGVVVDGVTRTAPNLHRKWEGYNLQQAVTDLTGRPARVLNDAGVQGLGVISNRGVEIVLTLGTGMGFALYVNGNYVPNIELAHHPFRKELTYEEYVGNAARLKVGNRKWSARVLRILSQIQATFNPSIVYIGGGNSSKIRDELPAGVKRTDNIAGLLGGIALWRDR